jgi:hypothetical protein
VTSRIPPGIENPSKNGNMIPETPFVAAKNPASRRNTTASFAPKISRTRTGSGMRLR